MFSHLAYTLDARSLKQADVLTKVRELSKTLGLKSLQIVFEGWEAVMGDLKWDTARFPEPTAMVAAIHKLGYLVKLTVNSFYNVHSDVFKSHPHFFLRDPKNHSHPFTFTWKDPSQSTSASQTGSLFNYPTGSATLYHSRDWLVHRLKDIERFEKVDSFRFVGGDLGQFGVSKTVRTDSMRTDHYSNEYIGYYAATGSWMGGLVDLDAGYHTQLWRNFLRMRDIGADWASLKNVLPQVLTIGLAGHLYVVAPTLSRPTSGSAPTKELYIRWLQLTTFFASMQLSSGVTLSAKAANLTTAFVALHLQHVPTLVAKAHAAAKAEDFRSSDHSGT